MPFFDVRFLLAPLSQDAGLNRSKWIVRAQEICVGTIVAHNDARVLVAAWVSARASF
jgi:hypothetical protein